MPWFADCKSTAAALALALALLARGGAAFAADAVPKLDEAAALRAGQAAIGRTIGDYTLLDRQGRPVRLADYRGKPLLVSFVYTGCFQVCPANTRLLLDAVKGLDRLFGPERYRVVSIGFNQPFDSPTAMRAFAAQQRIDRPNWEFLSPPAPIVDALTRDFGFSWLATPAGFDHVVGVTIVDGEGRIRAQVYGDRVSAAQLGEPLKALLGQPSAAAGPSFADLVERVRILCTVYDPETGEYRTNWALAAEVVMGLAFFATVGGYLHAERRQRRRALASARALPAAET
jgi:protein SCO1/2